MKAIAYSQNLEVDHPQALFAVDLALKAPKAHDILVDVQATSINPVDTKVRKGMVLAAEEFKVLGWDACAEVVAVGELCTHLKPGDRVWYAGDIRRHGSNAEQQLVDSRLVALSPSTLKAVEAAALPLTSLTAWEALFERLGYQSESSAWNQEHPLLIINGAGGVGSIAIQLCKIVGIPVTVTASREASQQWCKQLGADEVIPHAGLADVPDGHFARILCAHDTDRYFNEMARLVAPFGLICSLSSASQTHDIQLLLQKSAGFVWEFMFTKSQHAVVMLKQQSDILARIAEWVDQGTIKSTMTESVSGLTVENLLMMHRKQESGRLIGKQVLTIS